MKTRYEVEIEFSHANNFRADEQYIWCAENIDAYGQSWRTFRSVNGAVFSFADEQHAVIFRLTFSHAPYNAKFI